MHHNDEIKPSFEYVGLVIEPPVKSSSDNNERNFLIPPQGEEFDPNQHESEIVLDSFSEMVTEHPVDRRTPLVVLDAANIGWNYGNGASFSVYGLQLALMYFQQFHVEVKTFLPSSYAQKRLLYGSKNGTERTNALMETEDMEVLKGLLQKKVIALVPAGESDDIYILNYARAHAGFVISNDYYQDHLKSLEIRSMQLSMRLWLAENRISYTFVDHNSFYINPNSALAFRLEQFSKHPTTNMTPRSSVSHHVHLAIQHLGKAIAELNKLERYSEIKTLILMKAKLHLEVSISKNLSFLSSDCYCNLR